ncbi:MAG: IS1 family transposase [Actinomycetota bacterium]
MNRLSTQTRAQIVWCLVEGMSIRATVRVTGAAKNTVTKLLADLGEACDRYQDETLRNLPCKRIQCDEVWSYCYAKQKNVPDEHRGTFGYGDVWTWTAIDTDTKLVPCWLIGERHTTDAITFMIDLRARLANRVQLTTDGHRHHLAAVEGVFTDLDVNYAMLIKLYGRDPESDAKRYSPAKCTGIRKIPISGDADEGHISTSYVERQNLAMRMGMRRFTRLTNAFLKKVENLAHAVSLHFMHYNFCRVHQTLGTTPAVAAGVADHVWTIEEVVGQLDDADVKAPQEKEVEQPAAEAN